MKAELKFVNESGKQYSLKDLVCTELEYDASKNLHKVVIMFHKSNSSFDYERIEFFSSKHELEALGVRRSIDELKDLL